MPLLKPEDAAKSLIVLTGSEDSLRLKVLEELIAEATKESDFDIEVLNASDTDPAQWIASASTVPFLAPRRTVVVRHVLRRRHPKEIFDALGDRAFYDLPPTAQLILVCDDEPAPEPGDNTRHEQWKAAWEKRAKDAGGAVWNVKVDGKKLGEEIKAEAARRQRTISPRAVEALIEMTGGSLSRAMEEFEKLDLYVAEGQPMQEADVRSVVMPSREYNVYALVDAAMSGNAGEALKQLKTLVGTNHKTADAAFQRIFPTLGRNLRLLWQARTCIEAKCAPPNVPDRIASTFPDQPNLLKEADWSQSKQMRLAKLVSFDQLSQCFELVAKADAEIKGIEESFDVVDTLERMVLQMASLSSARR
jgi:DNA polymerase III delta subunit